MLAVIRLNVNFITLYLLFKMRTIKESGKIKLENESSLSKLSERTDAVLQNCLIVYLKLWSFFPASYLMTPQSELNDPLDGRLAGVDQDVLNFTFGGGIGGSLFSYSVSVRRRSGPLSPTPGVDSPDP